MTDPYRKALADLLAEILAVDLAVAPGESVADNRTRIVSRFAQIRGGAAFTREQLFPGEDQRAGTMDAQRRQTHANALRSFVEAHPGKSQPWHCPMCGPVHDGDPCRVYGPDSDACARHV